MPDLQPLALHLPVITSRIEFQLIKASYPPIITPRIDFNQEWGSDHNADEDIDMISEHNYDSEPADFLIDDEDTLDNNDYHDNKKIAKPAGEPGRPNSGGYNIEHELRGWSPDMVTSVNKFVKQKADDILDVTKSYSKQKPADLTSICTKKQFPILEKYEKHWPVRDMLKLYLKYTSESYRKQGSTFRQKTKARKGRTVGEMDS